MKKYNDKILNIINSNIRNLFIKVFLIHVEYIIELSLKILINFDKNLIV